MVRFGRLTRGSLIDFIVDFVSEYYEKGESSVKEHDPKQDFKSLPDNTIVVKIKRGSKFKNIMVFVEKSFKEEENKHMVFSGCGDAIEKTISCVEITKTKFKDLHQITKLSVLRVEEFWEPTKPDLDRLKVNREIPMVSILLCKDPLDSSEAGYQAPNNSEKVQKKTRKRKKIDSNRNSDDRDDRLKDKPVKEVVEEK